MRIIIEGHENKWMSKVADEIGWMLNGAGEDEPNFSVTCIDGDEKWERPNAYNKGQALIIVKRAKGSGNEI